MTQSIQLLVVDDHTLFRRGLIALLSQDGRFQIVREAGDIGTALRGTDGGKPDVILLDNHLPGVGELMELAHSKKRFLAQEF